MLSCLGDNVIDDLAGTPRLHRVRLDHTTGAAVEGGCPAAFAARRSVDGGKEGSHKTELVKQWRENACAYIYIYI